MSDVANEWSWYHEALGRQVILCEKDVTKEDIETYIEQSPAQKGYDKRSLKFREVPHPDACSRGRITNVKRIIAGKPAQAPAAKHAVFNHARGSRWVYGRNED